MTEIKREADLITAARHCAKGLGCSGCPMEKAKHCQRTLLSGLADTIENKQREIDALRKAKNAREMEAPYD
jgi:hypothetical protein